MAHWNGGSETSDDGMILQIVNSLQIPDIEDHVIEEAESVTRNFFYETYRLEISANVDASNRQLANVDVPDSNSTSISQLFNPDTTRYVGYWEGKT